MVSHSVTVCTSDLETGRLPTFVQEGALLMRGLAARGLLPQLAQRLQVRRQGGYQGIDAFLYLLLTVTSPQEGGLGWLWKHASDWAQPLGALADRDRLMSDTSVRRLLRTVTDEEIDAFSSWLLLEASGVRGWMSAPAAHTYDAQGQPWQLFAFDPVRIPLRCGQLRDEPAFPKPNRRSRRLGRRGYRGRKRGELVFTASIVELLGCAVVLDVMVHPGNGRARTLFARALQTVQDTLRWWNLPQPRPLLLCDGEFGHVPCLTLANQQGLPLLTRCGRYTLLDEPEIWQRLQQGRWEAVEDAGRGPVRYACEVGQVLLHPAPTTRTDDGQPFAPVWVRLVVSRYAATDNDNGRGRLIDGQRYELYVSVAVAPEAFPARDVVAAFYSRCGQECHFQQHQQQLGLQDLLCFQPAGQRLAMLTALFVWNARLSAGAALHPPLPSPPPPQPRPESADCPLPALPERRLPLPAEEPLQAEAPVQGVRSETDGQTPEASAVASQEGAGSSHPFALLEEALAALDWPQLLQRHPGYTFDPQTRSLYTEEQVALPLSGVEQNHRGAALRFAARVPQRQQASVSLPLEVAAVLHDQLRAARKAARKARQAACKARQPSVRRPVRPPRPLRASGGAGSETVKVAVDGMPPPYAVGWSALQPAAARQTFVRAAQQSVCWVELGPLPPSAPRHPLVQPDRAQRQHRRLSWSQHLQRHQRRRPCTIHLEVPSNALARWLAPTDGAAPAGQPPPGGDD